MKLVKKITKEVNVWRRLGYIKAGQARHVVTDGGGRLLFQAARYGVAVRWARDNKNMTTKERNDDTDN